MSSNRWRQPSSPDSAGALVGQLALFVAMLAVACAPGCGDDSGGGTSDVDISDASDGGPTVPPRLYALGARAEGFTPVLGDSRGFALEPIGDLALAEALVLPLDLYGVPWGSFTGPDNQAGELPAAWLARIEAVEAALAAADAEAMADMKIVLSLSPLNEGANNPAPKAGDDTGVLTLQEGWTNQTCFNPLATESEDKYPNEYAGYVRWMASRFDADFVVLGRVMNRYEENCGTGPYEGALTFTTAAHAALAALDEPPVTVVSVDVEDLYGLPKQPGRCVTETPQACLEERKGLLDGIVADRIGLESQPLLVLEETGSVPQDWLSRVTAARADIGWVVTSTSLPPVELYTQPNDTQCLPLSDSTETLQRSWLDQVLSTAETGGMDFVVWHPLTDLADAAVAAACPCPDASDPALCYFLETANQDTADATRRLVTAGLFAMDGTARAGGEIWHDLAIPETLDEADAGPDAGVTR